MNTFLQSNSQRNFFSFSALTGLIPGARGKASRTANESAAVEAQKVRDMAYAYSKTDPGFASDLYAAAARHEGLQAD